MMILSALIYVISVSSIIALRSIISSPKLTFLTNSLGHRLASKHSSLGDGDSDVPEVLKEKLQLDLSQLKPFLKIAVPFFREDKPARDSLLSVLGLTLVNNGISVAFSYISRDFYTALNNRDEHMFYEKIELFFAALVIAVPVAVYYRYTREKLSLYWREALTAKVIDKYFSNRTFYTLESLRDEEVDNPDQRIAEDIRAFTKTSLDFLITVVTSVIDLASFSAILFQIYPGLFGAIIAYAGVGSVVTTNLGRSLVGLNYDKLQREANFRFSLFRARENAEAIAFYDSDATLEEEGSWAVFQKALQAQFRIILKQRDLEFFTTGYRYIVQILPSLIVAPLYFAGKVELGAVSQSFGAFNHILSDFSLLINQFEQISAFSAGLTRLSTFIDRIDSLSDAGDMGANSTIAAVNSTFTFASRGPTIHMTQWPLRALNSLQGMDEEDQGQGQGQSHMQPRELLLDVRNLTVITPDGSRVIIGGKPVAIDGVVSSQPDEEFFQGADLRIYRGDTVLVVGTSGSGKSSLVRAIAGLWQLGHGSVVWATSGSDFSPSSDGGPVAGPSSGGINAAPKYVFFLPQKSYNIIGSLRQQIMYPNIKKAKTPPSKLSSFQQQSDPSEELEIIVEDESIPDEFFLDLLERVRLGSLAAKMGGGDASKGLRKVTDWSKVLSLGEQQRLAFARILFNKPEVIVLDEATSALDLASEASMYNLLGDIGCTYISVGHRPTLLNYHRRRLILRGPGLSPVERSIPLPDEAASSSSVALDLIDLTSH